MFAKAVYVCLKLEQTQSFESGSLVVKEVFESLAGDGNAMMPAYHTSAISASDGQGNRDLPERFELRHAHDDHPLTDESIQADGKVPHPAVVDESSMDGIQQIVDDIGKAIFEIAVVVEIVGRAVFSPPVHDVYVFGVLAERGDRDSDIVVKGAVLGNENRNVTIEKEAEDCKQVLRDLAETAEVCFPWELGSASAMA